MQPDDIPADQIGVAESPDDDAGNHAGREGEERPVQNAGNAELGEPQNGRSPDFQELLADTGAGIRYDGAGQCSQAPE